MIGSIIVLPLALEVSQDIQPSSAVLYQSCSHLIEYWTQGILHQDANLCTLTVLSERVLDHAKSPGQPIGPQELPASFCPPRAAEFHIENPLPAVHVYVRYMQDNNLVGITEDDGVATMVSALIHAWPCSR